MSPAVFFTQLLLSIAHVSQLSLPEGFLHFVFLREHVAHFADWDPGCLPEPAEGNRGAYFGSRVLSSLAPKSAVSFVLGTEAGALLDPGCEAFASKLSALMSLSSRAGVGNHPDERRHSVPASKAAKDGSRAKGTSLGESYIVSGRRDGENDKWKVTRRRHIRVLKRRGLICSFQGSLQCYSLLSKVVGSMTSLSEAEMVAGSRL